MEQLQPWGSTWEQVPGSRAFYRVKRRAQLSHSWQSERRVHRRGSLYCDTAGSPQLSLLPPSLTALCQPNYTCPLRRTPRALSCSGAAGHTIMVIHPPAEGALTGKGIWKDF